MPQHPVIQQAQRAMIATHNSENKKDTTLSKNLKDTTTSQLVENKTKYDNRFDDRILVGVGLWLIISVLLIAIHYKFTNHYD